MLRLRAWMGVVYRIFSVCEYYANWAAASSASWGLRLRWNVLRLRVWRVYGYRMCSVCESGGGLCIESAPFASIKQIGRRPRRPRGVSVCDGMRSICGSGGGMGIECAPFASLERGLFPKQRLRLRGSYLSSNRIRSVGQDFPSSACLAYLPRLA